MMESSTPIFDKLVEEFAKTNAYIKNLYGKPAGNSHVFNSRHGDAICAGSDIPLSVVAVMALAFPAQTPLPKRQPRRRAEAKTPPEQSMA
jgi:hypothetical protein